VDKCGEESTLESRWSSWRFVIGGSIIAFMRDARVFARFVQGN